MADGPISGGGQSGKTLFSRDLSVTASLGPPSINRGCGRPFEVAEHLGDLVSLWESAGEPSNSLVLTKIVIRL